MAKPIRLELRWKEDAMYPLGGLWVTRRGMLVERQHGDMAKKEAIREAAQYARNVAEREGVGVVLVFCRRDGNYCKGHGAERSYGADNPRRPG